MTLKNQLKSLLILLLHSLILLACSEPKTDYKLILGAWETADIVSANGKDFTEHTSFYEGDSAIISIKINGNETERYKFNYHINEKDAKLHIERDASIQNNYRIELMNETELLLLDLNSGAKKRYLRKK